MCYIVYLLCGYRRTEDRLPRHTYHHKEQSESSSESETDAMVSTRHLNAKKKKAAEKRKAAALKDDKDVRLQI